MTKTVCVLLAVLALLIESELLSLLVMILISALCVHRLFSEMAENKF